MPEPNDQAGSGQQGNQPGGDGGTAQQGATSAQQPQQSPRTFTQEDLDRVVSERLGRERDKFKDYDELKKAKGELDSLKAAQMSESEKLQAKLADLEKKEADWQRERQELVTRQAVTAAANKLNVVDPDAAYRLLDLSKVEYGDDGTPKNVESLVADLVKEKAYLVAPPAASSGSPTNPARSQVSAGQQETDAQRRQRLWGGGANVFDPGAVRAAGGGVFFDPDVNPKQRPRE